MFLKKISPHLKQFSSSRESSGAALIQAMIAIATVSVISLAVTKFLDGSLNSMRNMNAINEVAKVKKVLDIALRTPDICKDTFVNNPGTGTTLAFNKVTIDDPVNAPAYSIDVSNYLPIKALGGIGGDLVPAVGSFVGDTGLKVVSARFINVRQLPPNYLMDLVLTFRFASNVNEMPMVLPMRVSTDAGGALTGCQVSVITNTLTETVIFDGLATPLDQSSPFTWKIPSGVTTIKYEIWGAGGGSGFGRTPGNAASVPPVPSGPPYLSYGAGGGGGAYISGTIKNIADGSTLYITAGGGGSASTDSTITGKTGRPSCLNLVGPDPTCTIAAARAPGGWGGGSPGGAIQYSQGGGGGRTWDVGTSSYVENFTSAEFGAVINEVPTNIISKLAGQNSNAITPGFRIPGPPYIFGNNGNGGDAAGGGGAGGLREPVPTGGPAQTATGPSSVGRYPGGGGGGTVLPLSSSQGGNGSPGKIIIWY